MTRNSVSEGFSVRKLVDIQLATLELQFPDEQYYENKKLLRKIRRKCIICIEVMISR
jgi:hypothetical protein